MEFFNSAVDVLKTLVVALGAGLGVWGAVNLMEGYGGDNPSANAHVRSNSNAKCCSLLILSTTPPTSDLCTSLRIREMRFTPSW